MRKGKERKILEIEACLTEESEKEFIGVRVDKKEDFYELAKRIDSPIFKCKEKKEIFIIDVKNKLKYTLKNEGAKA